ncbi:hypothetical protein EMIT0P258_20405 [Pseudomonas sp. IT-P258]
MLLAQRNRPHPRNHLLRNINWMLNLSDLHHHLVGDFCLIMCPSIYRKLMTPINPRLTMISPTKINAPFYGSGTGSFLTRF